MRKIRIIVFLSFSLHIAPQLRADDKVIATQAAQYFSESFKAAVLKNQKADVANMVHYPFKVNLRGKPVIFFNPTQFLESYDKVISPFVIQSLLHQHQFGNGSFYRFRVSGLVEFDEMNGVMKITYIQPNRFDLNQLYDEEEIYIFFRNFQEAIRKNNPSIISEYIDFPLSFKRRNSNSELVETQELELNQFIKLYEYVLPEKKRKEILSSSSDDLADGGRYGGFFLNHKGLQFKRCFVHEDGETYEYRLVSVISWPNQ